MYLVVTVLDHKDTEPSYGGNSAGQCCPGGLLVIRCVIANSKNTDGDNNNNSSDSGNDLIYHSLACTIQSTLHTLSHANLTCLSRCIYSHLANKNPQRDQISTPGSTISK